MAFSSSSSQRMLGLHVWNWMLSIQFITSYFSGKFSIKTTRWLQSAFHKISILPHSISYALLAYCCKKKYTDVTNFNNLETFCKSHTQLQWLVPCIWCYSFTHFYLYTISSSQSLSTPKNTIVTTIQVCSHQNTAKKKILYLTEQKWCINLKQYSILR